MTIIKCDLCGQDTPAYCDRKPDDKALNYLEVTVRYNIFDKEARRHVCIDCYPKLKEFLHLGDNSTSK
jgi:hypothetical protein